MSPPPWRNLASNDQYVAHIDQLWSNLGRIWAPRTAVWASQRVKQTVLRSIGLLTAGISEAITEICFYREPAPHTHPKAYLSAFFGGPWPAVGVAIAMACDDERAGTPLGCSVRIPYARDASGPATVRVDISTPPEARPAPTRPHRNPRLHSGFGQMLRRTPMQPQQFAALFWFGWHFHCGCQG